MSILNKNARLQCAEGEHCEHVGWQHRGRHSTFDWLGRVHRSELSAAFARLNGEPVKFSLSLLFCSTVLYVEGQLYRSEYFFSGLKLWSIYGTGTQRWPNLLTLFLE
jgi:hypothetical protein